MEIAESYKLKNPVAFCDNYGIQTFWRGILFPLLQLLLATYITVIIDLLLIWAAGLGCFKLKYLSYIFRATQGSYFGCNLCICKNGHTDDVGSVDAGLNEIARNSTIRLLDESTQVKCPKSCITFILIYECVIYDKNSNLKLEQIEGSECGTVDNNVVTSDAGGLGFDCHSSTIFIEQLFAVRRKDVKEAGNSLFQIRYVSSLYRIQFFAVWLKT